MLGIVLVDELDKLVEEAAHFLFFRLWFHIRHYIL